MPVLVVLEGIYDIAMCHQERCILYQLWGEKTETRLYHKGGRYLSKSPFAIDKIQRVDPVTQHRPRH